MKYALLVLEQEQNQGPKKQPVLNVKVRAVRLFPMVIFNKFSPAHVAAVKVLSFSHLVQIAMEKAVRG